MQPTTQILMTMTNGGGDPRRRRSDLASWTAHVGRVVALARLASLPVKGTRREGGGGGVGGGADYPHMASVSGRRQAVSAGGQAVSAPCPAGCRLRSAPAAA